jgi:hypothetical protein
MDIKSFDEIRWVDGKWNLYSPPFRMKDFPLESYTVQRGEDMRIDLVMKSIYDDVYTFSDLDIILHINHIDNPLNIREGMIIFYPLYESLAEYRFTESITTSSSKSVKQSLGVLNKTTRVDEKRKKFLDSDYSLPPVVLPESRPSVTVDDNKIIVGGL